MDTDDAFHVYRLEVFGDDSIDVYYDDVLTLTGTLFDSLVANGAAPRVLFGNASNSSQGVSEWTSFGHDGASEQCGDAAVDPGEQCDDGNTDPGDGCDALCQDEIAPGVCAAAPLAGCLAAAKASLAVVEKKLGSEKLKAKLAGFDAPTAQGSFGDPVTGATPYDLCVYDADDQLAATLSVDRAGESCGAKPCFKDKAGKGWLYKDAAALADGTKKLLLGSGPPGKGKAIWQAGNKSKKGQTFMPTGIAAALTGASSAIIQLVARDAACFEATLGTVKKADGARFKAKAP